MAELFVSRESTAVTHLHLSGIFGWLINVMRLKRILHTDNFAGQRVLAAVAGLLAKGAKAPKWKRLAATPVQPHGDETLFFSEDGRPLPALSEPEPLFAGYG